MTIKFKEIDPGKIKEHINGCTSIKITSISSVSNPKNSTVIFINDLNHENFEKIQEIKDSLIILNEKDKSQGAFFEKNNGVIYSAEPRYTFAKILEDSLSLQELKGKLTFDAKNNIFIGENVKIAENAVIESGAVIYSDTEIGENTYIMSGTKIGPKVKIGKKCTIRENSVIGGFGFGFAVKEGEIPVRLHHFGGVNIGDNVEIGALNTVCSGTIDPTVIENHVKTDDHVHIAHNCHIEQKCIITACAEISGSVRVGEETWIGPNVSILQKLKIGKKSLIGIGSIVMSDVPEKTKIASMPARIIGQC